MRIAKLIRVSLILLGIVASGTIAAANERVVELKVRAQNIRALLVMPEHPIGSVVLLAGGHGNLNISASGKIGWGANNQLVRTRAAYAEAGYATLVPDIAPDMKRGDGVVPMSRWSHKFASDIGSWVAYMRLQAKPVFVVGTSRAALTVFAAAVSQKGEKLADGFVVTSGMLKDFGDKQPSVERNVGQMSRVSAPVFLIYHEDDACPYTPASSAAKFKPLLSSAPRVDIGIIKGGDAGSGDPCQAISHHGFLGQDDVVVRMVIGWLKKVAKP
jgi:dienelactone hydrolase